MTTIPSIKLEWINHKGVHRTDWIDGEWLHRLHRFPEKDHGKEMASLLANDCCDLNALQDAAAVMIDIMWPSFYAGSYLIQVHHHRVDDMPETTLTKVLHGLSGKDAYVGRTALLRSPEHRPPFDLVALARAVPPEGAKDAYEKLSDSAGETYGNVRAMWEHEQVMALEEMIATKGLQGKGWIVRSRVTGEIGYLAAARTDRDGLEVPEFGNDTRIVLQLAKGIGDAEEDMIVCFVPAPESDWVPAIVEQLEAAVAPAPAL